MKPTITTIEKEDKEAGIFFRFPIQTKEFEPYKYDENSPESAYEFIQRMEKNCILRWLNKDLFNRCKTENWFDDIDFGGFKAKVIVSPVYFERFVRRVNHLLNNHPVIQEIKVFGEEPIDNQCGGACIEEKAIFYFHSHRKCTVKTKDQFKYAYKHVIEEKFIK